VLLAAAVAVVACSSSAGRDDPSPPSDGAGDPPAEVAAELVGDAEVPDLEVTFSPTSDAEAYLLVLDGREDPVRIEAADCSDETCRALLDRMTVGDSESVTVSTAVDDKISAPSAEVAIPEWPAPVAANPPAEGTPIQLVVTRVDPAGRLSVETETVDPASVATRIAALEATEGVLGVGVDAPGEAHAMSEAVQDQTDDYPDGLATWQQEAFDFSSLPPEPRGEGVTIAMIDSGVDVHHPAFAGADITTINMIEPGRDTPDHHGTATTSLIVGQPESKVPGIATAATIRAYDVFNGADEPALGDTARAIVQAVDDGADVINLSLSHRCNQVGPVHFDCDPGALLPAVEYAESHGVVVVAAAGNDGDGAGFCDGGNPITDVESNGDHWPAKYPTVIAVGGTTRSGEPWVCSPDKSYVDVLAPADALLAAWFGDDEDGNDDGYAVRSGTSFSAPLVSGLIAVILAERPDLTPAEIRDLLAGAVDENGRLLPGAVLSALGLVEGPALDPTTLDRVTAFAVEIRILDGHPLRRLADELGADPKNEMRLPGQSSVYAPTDDPILRITGVFLVDRDDTVTGWARLHVPAGFEGVTQSDHPEPIVRSLIGSSVVCPARAFRTFPPALAFYWELRGVVGGKVVDRAGGEDVEFSLSLGEGATPHERGELPGIVISYDNLDECGDAIATEKDRTPGGHWFIRDWDSAYETVEQVEARRNHNVEVLEAANEDVLDLFPLEITGAFSTRVATSGTLESTYGTYDNMQVRLIIGSQPRN
jgi:subtilisin family serine protease